MHMRIIKVLGIASAILLIISCFLPWVSIHSQQLTITGVETKGTSFGKPGYLHFIFSLLFLVFTLIPRLWAKRVNLLVVALNTAWAVRNFSLVIGCQAGECPELRTGVYLMLASSVLMLISALFPDIKLTQDKPGSSL